MLSFTATGLSTSSPAPFGLVDGGYLAYSPSESPQLNLLALCTLDSVPTLASMTQEPSMEHWDGQLPCHRVEENRLAVSTAPSSGASSVSAAPSLRSSASSTSLASTAPSSLFDGDRSTFSSGRSFTPSRSTPPGPPSPAFSSARSPSSPATTPPASAFPSIFPPSSCSTA
ncbi:hypothetical protein JCM10213_000511 [Rhodosporidiobolus nylandii]